VPVVTVQFYRQRPAPGHAGGRVPLFSARSSDAQALALPVRLSNGKAGRLTG